MSPNKQELEGYLSTIYPNSSIDTEHTLAGQITIPFNSTNDVSSEAEVRITQAVERAKVIFHRLFDNTNNRLWVIAYEYIEDEIVEYDSKYFFEQFWATTEFELSDEIVNSRIIIIDDNGDETFEKVKAKLSIGKVHVQNINIENILLGISNRDNGYQPMIGQSIYFLDPSNHTGFHMSDDRGFFAWANEPDKLRELYHTYVNWISEYTREDIDVYFH